MLNNYIPSGLFHNKKRAVRSHTWPKIALIGSYPEPYGGISIHCERLVERMKAAKLDFVFYNTLSSSQCPPYVLSVHDHKRLWYLLFCLRHKCKIVHLHSVGWYGRLLFGLIATIRPGKYIMSIQGRSISEKLAGHGFLSRLTRILLQKMDAVIACNPEIERELIEVVKLPPDKVRHIPAFIPPPLYKESDVPDDIQAFTSSRQPLISAVGWVGQKFKGSDIYGFDMILELVERLKHDYPGIGVAVSINGGEPSEIHRMVEHARQTVGENILFIERPLKDVVSLIRLSDLFVRPTNTDGDAVSIREALYVGTPVVASNAAPRPEPCVLFRSRDMDDFELKVRDSLQKIDILKKHCQGYDVGDAAPRILRLYEELGGI